MTGSRKTYSVAEVAEQLGTSSEAVRAAAARLRIERFRGAWHFTDDEIAAIREELGIASVLDDADEEDDSEDDSDDIDGDDSEDDSDDIDEDDSESDDIEEEDEETD